MEDAISGNQWQSAEALDGGCNQWPSMAIGRSSVVISATLTCGIARIAWRHRRRGTLPASHPSSRISPSPRGSRREIAARSVDLPAIRGNQRQSAAMSGNERSSTVIRDHQVAIRGHHVAIRGHQVAIRGHQVAIRGHQVAIRGHQIAIRGHPVAIKGHQVAIRGHHVAIRGNQVAIGLTRARTPHDRHVVPSSYRDCQPLHRRHALWGI